MAYVNSKPWGVASYGFVGLIYLAEINDVAVFEVASDAYHVGVDTVLSQLYD